LGLSGLEHSWFEHHDQISQLVPAERTRHAATEAKVFFAVKAHPGWCAGSVIGTS